MNNQHYRKNYDKDKYSNDQTKYNFHRHDQAGNYNTNNESRNNYKKDDSYKSKI